MRLALAVVFGCIASSSIADVEQNSFLNRHISSVNDLVRQIKSDPVVRDRYLRHYAMSVDELARYFETLHVDSLPKDRDLPVYGVPGDGNLHFHNMHLKKGMKVLASSAGTPVILMKCGNPIGMGPKTTIYANSMSPATPPMAPKEELVALEAPMELNAIAETPNEIFEPVAPVDVPPEFHKTPPTTIPTTGSAPQPIISHGGNGFAILPILLFAPLIPHGPGGGGGPTGPPPPPVPEPASIVGLGLGAMALLRKKLKS